MKANIVVSFQRAKSLKNYKLLGIDGEIGSDARMISPKRRRELKVIRKGLEK